MLMSLCQVLKREAVSWCKILKISLYCVLFVHSWVQGKETHHHDLGQMWCLRGASDALQIVSFKNKLSFQRFYIFLDFTFNLICPLMKVKSVFQCASLLASGLEEGWRSLTIVGEDHYMFSDQASYTVDNKTGSRGMAPLILNLKARHIDWSTSCCSQSSCPALGKLPLISIE